jgi:hypothetical protein
VQIRLYLTTRTKILNLLIELVKEAKYLAVVEPLVLLLIVVRRDAGTL